MKYDTIRRGLSLFLATVFFCLQLSSSAFAALPAPSVELEYTCDTDVPEIGSTLTFFIRGTNTASVCLMIVDPFSQPDFQYADQVTVELKDPGVYTFIAYGTNTIDTSAPGFLRCKSTPVQIVLAGNAAAPTAAPLAPDAIEIMAWLGQDWQTLNGQQVANKNVQLCILGSGIPQEAELEIVVRSNAASRVLYDGPASAILTDDSDSLTDQIACTISARSALDELLIQEYFQTSVSVEACFTLPDGQSAQSSGDLRLCNYTNAMRYMEQFLGDNGRLFSGKKGADLKIWLDMSPRSDAARDDSGYLLMEQRYLDLDSRDVAYYIGTGGLKVLETIGNLGINLITGAISDAEMKELFPESGGKGYTYYTLLSSLYMDYVSTLYQRMTAADEALQVADQVLGGAVNVLNTVKSVSDAAEARQVMIAMNETNNLMIISNMWNTDSSSDVCNILTSAGTKMAYTTPSAANIQLGVLEDILAESLDSKHVILNFTSHDMYFEATGRVNDFYANMQFSSSESKWFREMNIFAIDSSLDAMENTSAYQELATGQKQALQNLKKETARAAAEKGRLLSEKAGKVIDTVDTTASVISAGVSWYHYASQLEYMDGYYDMYFSILDDVTDDYIDMLNGWIGMLSQPHSQTEAINALLAYAPDTDWELDWEVTAMKEALLLMKQDILATQDETSQSVVDRINGNKEVFTSGSLVSAIYNSLQVVTKIPGLKNAIASLSATIVSKVASVTGKSVSTVASAVKQFNVATALAQVAHLILSNTAGNVFSHYDALKQLVTCQYSLTAAFYDLFEEYAENPSDSTALACIAALNMIRAIKQQGETLMEIYYLKDFYEDLGIEYDERLQAILLNEYSANVGHLDVSEYLQKLHKVYIVKEDTPLHTLYYLPPGSTAKYSVDGLELQPLPDNLENLPSYSLYLAVKHMENAKLQTTPFGSPRGNSLFPHSLSAYQQVYKKYHSSVDQEKFTPGNVLADGSAVYADVFYCYRHDPLEYILTDLTVKSYLQAEEKINALLDIDEEDLHWYNFSEKDDLKELNKLSWVELTRSYIDSLEMYDESKTY